MTNNKPPLSPSHKKAVSKARQMTVKLIVILDECIKKESFDNNFLWGEKETAVSVLTKLTQNLIKLIEIEREVKLKKPQDSSGLSPEEIEILKRYVNSNDNNPK